MKKIISTIIVLVFLGNHLFAQKELTEEKKIEKEIFLNNKNTFSFSPFNILFKQFQFSIERRFGVNNSVLILGSILHNRDQLYYSPSGYQFGLAGEFHYRKYIFSNTLRKKKNPKSKNTFGVYVAPFCGYQYLEREIAYFDENSFTYNFVSHDYQNAVQLGMLTGINFNLLKGRLSLDFYGGFAEKLSFGSELVLFYYNDPGILQYGVFGIIPKANFQLGYNF